MVCERVNSNTTSCYAPTGKGAAGKSLGWLVLRCLAYGGLGVATYFALPKLLPSRVTRQIQTLSALGVAGGAALIGEGVIGTLVRQKEANRQAVENERLAHESEELQSKLQDVPERPGSAELDGLRAQLQQAREAQAELEGQVADQTRQLADKEAELATAQSATREVPTADAELTRLRRQLQEVQGECAALEAERTLDERRLREKEAEVTAAQEATLKAEVNGERAVQATITQYKHMLALLQSDNDNLTDQVKKLQTKVKDMAALDLSIEPDDETPVPVDPMLGTLAAAPSPRPAPNPLEDVLELSSPAPTPVPTPAPAPFSLADVPEVDDVT